jgi:hypothetical protein
MKCSGADFHLLFTSRIPQHVAFLNPYTMALVIGTLPAHLQLESRLVSLPAEIKHMITALSFTTTDIIEDPTVSDGQNKKEHTSPLGLALLQTCQTLYHGTDRRPLFVQNVFRFTTVDNARTFLKLHPQISDLEIDVRRLHSDRPNLTREWLKYLAWESSSDSGTQASLREDAPCLKTLRLNFESWPRIPMFRAELWALLREMAGTVRGLQRVVVIGASKGSSMAKRLPWSPAHYVGADEVAFNDLVPRIWKCVAAADDAKIIRWFRYAGRIHLEVVSKSHLPRTIWPGPTTQMEENGSCDWNGYMKCESCAMDPTMK